MCVCKCTAQTSRCFHAWLGNAVSTTLTVRTDGEDLPHEDTLQHTHSSRRDVQLKNFHGTCWLVSQSNNDSYIASFLTKWLYLCTGVLLTVCFDKSHGVSKENNSPCSFFVATHCVLLSTQVQIRDLYQHHISITISFKPPWGHLHHITRFFFFAKGLRSKADSYSAWG